MLKTFFSEPIAKTTGYLIALIITVTLINAGVQYYTYTLYATGFGETLQTHEGIMRAVFIVLFCSCLSVIAFSGFLSVKIYTMILRHKEIEQENLRAYESLLAIIDGIPVGVILVNPDRTIMQINEETAKILRFDSFKQAKDALIGEQCQKIFCNADTNKCPLVCNDLAGKKFTEEHAFQCNGSNDEPITILKSVIPLTLDTERIIMEVFIDITERKANETRLKQERERANEMARKAMTAEEKLQAYTENLEQMVFERTSELEEVVHDLQETQLQLIQSEKLAAIGQLAAGIAHEINTPIQYIGDNVRFFQDAFQDIHEYSNDCRGLIAAHATLSLESFVERLEQSMEKADLEYLEEELPQAIKQTLEGVERVSKIVLSMKEFSHPGSEDKSMVDINKALENTIIVSRNEWKYVADMETDYDRSLPLVSCLPGEINQVLLNLIINAAQAIESAADQKPNQKGRIRIQTRNMHHHVQIAIKDNGPGIPEAISSKIFDPFFTTKEVGKGTGQGLAISRSVIVDKHDGDISFETGADGTTFYIQLPISSEAN